MEAPRDLDDSREDRECGMRTRKIYDSTKKNKHGHSLCKHDKECFRCKECKGGGICGHKERRYVCFICSPLGWAKKVLRDLKRNAIAGGYTPPVISPEGIVALRRRASDCILCEQPLANEPMVLHHDHFTGEVIGGAHRRCNTMEGFLEKLNPRARKIFVTNVLRNL